MPFDDLLNDMEARRRKALAMGGPEKLAKRKAEGLLNARERIAHLVDPDSFIESGLFGTSANPADQERSPADGKIAGFARIDGREAAIVVNRLDEAAIHLSYFDALLDRVQSFVRH